MSARQLVRVSASRSAEVRRVVGAACKSFRRRLGTPATPSATRAHTAPATEGGDVPAETRLVRLVSRRLAARQEKVETSERFARGTPSLPNLVLRYPPKLPNAWSDGTEGAGRAQCSMCSMTQGEGKNESFLVRLSPALCAAKISPIFLAETRKTP